MLNKLNNNLTELEIKLLKSKNINFEFIENAKIPANNYFSSHGAKETSYENELSKNNFLFIDENDKKI